MRRLRVRAERESPAESGRRAPQMSGRAVHYSSPCRKVSVAKGWLSTPASCRFLAMPEMAAPGTFRTGVLSEAQSGHDTPSHFNPDDEYTARASPPLPHQAVERDRGEQHEAGVAVRLEHGKAQRRVGDIEAADLPDKMRGEERDPR